jgi:hypothetical protein
MQRPRRPPGEDLGGHAAALSSFQKDPAVRPVISDGRAGKARAS